MTSKKWILFADDEPDVVVVIKLRLEKEGFKVDTCTDGAAAIKLIHKNKYDLVILDYQMPEKNGEEVVVEIRKDDKYRQLPIFMMTAFRMRNEAHYKKLGATEIIYKPADDKDWLQLVKKHLK